MSEKKFQGAPFGVQTARFDVNGMHPKQKTPGTFTETPYCKRATHPLNTALGPGRYDVAVGGFSSESVDLHASGPGWARAYEVQRQAAMPHLLHKEQWEQKRMLKRKIGPGSYNIKDFLDAADAKPRSTRGIIQTRERRFRETEKQFEVNQGPGTYGEGGVPDAVLVAKDKKSASTKGMLDSSSGSNRSLPSVGSHLGPGNYNFKSSTDMMRDKVVSLRGPYELYSGDRNKPIKVGYQAAPNLTNLGPGQYEHKTGLDEWNSEHKKLHGRFLKMEQFPAKPLDRVYAFNLAQNPRDPSDPGPGHYNPVVPGLKSSPHNHKPPPFLSSAPRVDKQANKFFTGNFNPVGPGRYDIQRWDESQHRNGHPSMFKSKTVGPDQARSKFLQERIREKDVPKKERVFLVQPDKPCTSTAPCLDHTLFSQHRAVTVA